MLGHLMLRRGSSLPVLGLSAHKKVSARCFDSVAMVGATVNEGQPITGVEKGPDAFRSAGIENMIKSRNFAFHDMGNIPDFVADGGDDIGPGLAVQRGRKIGYKCGQVYDYVSDACADGKFVLTVGGDHSVGVGTLLGIAAKKPDVSIIWVDAHADCNTPASSPSGNYHGMPLAHALGWFDGSVAGFEWLDKHMDTLGPIFEERVALIGIRDLDENERAFIKKSGLHVYTMQDVDHLGIGQVMERALEAVDPKSKRPLHLSFDIDGCDPEVAPGTGTLARGGLSYREAHYICERLASTQRLGSMDMVEVNIDLDLPPDGCRLHGDDPHIGGTPTVKFGMELVASALGKTIM